MLCWVVKREALHAKLVCNQSPCVASEEGVGAMDKLGAQWLLLHGVLSVRRIFLCPRGVLGQGSVVSWPIQGHTQGASRGIGWQFFKPLSPPTADLTHFACHSPPFKWLHKWNPPPPPPPPFSSSRYAPVINICECVCYLLSPLISCVLPTFPNTHEIYNYGPYYKLNPKLPGLDL